MTGTPASPDSKTSLAEAAALTFEQWRTAGACLGGMVSRRVKELVKADEAKRADANDIREIGALVLAARRMMELENQYEQKVQSRNTASATGDANADDSDIVARFDALAHAAGLRITRIEEERAGDAGGGAQ